MALVLALAILVALSIAFTATMELSGASGRHATRENADQQAYAYAEAGINNAISVISKCGPGCSLGAPPAYPGDPSSTNQTVASGTVTYGGTFDADQIWTVKSIGSVKNPTGPSAAAVSRTITAEVKLNPPPFTFVSLNPSCDNHTLVIKSSGHLTVTSDVYVNSCSPADGFDLFGTGGTFEAPAISTFGGWETHDNSVVRVNGTTCVPLPLGTTKVFPPDPVPPWPGCPKTGQPFVTDPLQGQITAPALGPPAPGSGGVSAYIPGVKLKLAAAGAPLAVAYSPAVTLTGPAGTTGNGVPYNPVVNLNLAAAAGPLASAYANAVTLKGAVGTTSTAITYNPNVTVSGVLGTSSNAIPYSPAVTLNAAAVAGPKIAYTPNNVTLQAAAVASTSTVAYNPAITLKAAVTTTTTTTVTTTNKSVLAGDVISVDTEQMLVTNVAGGGAGKYDLTVVRAYNGTTAATHLNNAPVSHVLLDTTIVVTNAGAVEVAAGHTIQIDNEKMLVNSVTSVGGGPWALSVTRATNGTTEASHSAATTVFRVVDDTTIQVTNTGGSSSVVVGNTIQIDSEQMTVTGVGGSGPWNLTVARGANGTTEAGHSASAAVLKVVASTSVQVTSTSSAVANGDTIQIDGEQMTVTGVASGGTNLYDLTVVRGAGGTIVAGHATATVVYKVVPDTTVQVTNNTGTSSVVSGDTIKIDNEFMLVTGVTTVSAVSPGIWNLTVTRAVNGTVKAAHAVGAPVLKVTFPDQTIQVKNSGATSSVQNGDTIMIDNEQMTVTAVPVTAGASLWNLTVIRGVNGTAEVAHTQGAAKFVYKVVPDTTLQVTNTGATSAVAVNDMIQVDSEWMLVTAVSTAAANVWNLTVTRATGGTVKAAHAVNAAVKRLTYPDQTIQTTNTGGVSAVVVGDTIQIDNEQMYVSAVASAGGANYNLTVTRAWALTTETTHAANAIVYRVSLDGNAATPVLFTISDSGPLTLPASGSPGGTFTYYGGLCIGVPNGTTCSSANCKAANQYAGVAYNPAQSGTIGATGTTLTITAGGGTEIENGDYILIDSEKMLVTAGEGTTSVTVLRGQLGTALAAHTAKPIKYIVGTPDVTLTNGTYIMAGGGFFVCGAATLHAAHVLIVNTIDKDPFSGTVYAGLNQIQFDTTGDITLGPPTSGQYQGLSIYQPVSLAMSPFAVASYAPVQRLAAAIDDTQTNLTTVAVPAPFNPGELIYIDSEEMRVISLAGPNVTVDRGDTLVTGSDTQAPHAINAEIKKVTGSKCDGRSEALTDFLFSTIGNGINGLSGSIYAPHPYSLFRDSVSGTADIAIMTGCLYIDGATSTFTFQPELHFGAGSVTLLSQSG